MSSHPIIGAHTSAQGGVYQALIEGFEIGANAIQLFTANQKRWKGKPLDEATISLWKKEKERTQISHIMSHDSYLINLGSAHPENLEKSLLCFQEEIERCHQLDITYLNFHPGAAVNSSREECLEQIIQSLLKLEKTILKGNTLLLLESTAGQGTSVGWRFEDLKEIIKGVSHKIPLGVCIDTCHIFCAGYDIRTRQDWDLTLKLFNDIIGLNHLKAFHVNDSMKPFASRKDRHAALGEGEIGLECFKALMTHPLTKHLPKYLETPGGPPLWKEEISLLKRFAQESKE